MLFAAVEPVGHVCERTVPVQYQVCYAIQQQKLQTPTRQLAQRGCCFLHLLLALQCPHDIVHNARQIDSRLPPVIALLTPLSSLGQHAVRHVNCSSDVQTSVASKKLG